MPKSLHRRFKTAERQGVSLNQSLDFGQNIIAFSHPKQKSDRSLLILLVRIAP
jgi:hypothetical protein